MGFHSGSGVGDGCSVEMVTRKSVPPTLPWKARCGVCFHDTGASLQDSMGSCENCGNSLSPEEFFRVDLGLQQRVIKLESQIEELTSRLLKTCEIVFKLTGGHNAS